MNNIYLDNSASTKVLDTVKETFDVIINDYYANSSATHSLGNKNMSLFNEARKQIASLNNVRENEIIFTSGASESVNMAIKGTVFYNMKRKKHVVTTTLEHPSVLATLKYLEERFGIEVTYISPINGEITVDMVMDCVRDDTVLVTVIHVQSEMGMILPINDIAMKLEDKDVYFHVDICQSFGKIPVDLNLFDMASVSFHKLHGFKGSGMLFKKQSVKLDELIHGGNQQKFRSGTIPLELCVCGAKATRVAFETMQDNYEHVKFLNKLLMDYFVSKEGITINSKLDGSPYIINVSILDVHIAAFSRMMWEDKYFFSTKTACSSSTDFSSVIYELSSDKEIARNSIRISIGKFNTETEIVEFIKCFDRNLEKVRSGKYGEN